MNKLFKQDMRARYSNMNQSFEHDHESKLTTHSGVFDLGTEFYLVSTCHGEKIAIDD